MNDSITQSASPNTPANATNATNSTSSPNFPAFMRSGAGLTEEIDALTKTRDIAFKTYNSCVTPNKKALAWSKYCLIMLELKNLQK